MSSDAIQLQPLACRHPDNPILTAADFPGDVAWAFNPGVVKLPDGRYIMLARVEDSALHRYMWVCDSEDGIHFKPRPEPVTVPLDDPVYYEYCDLGRRRTYFDPRITPLDGAYYITIAAHTTHGCALGLFKTDQAFQRFDWLGLISEPDNRNGVLFPEKIDGRYWRLDRPNVDNAQDIWVQQSPDLIHWGHPRCLLRCANPVRWAQSKIGPGSVPIRTDHGWLCLIHGVRPQCRDSVYQLGAMLLDLQDPTRLIGAAKRAILWPTETYELIGQSPSVVFVNGAVLEDDGTVRIYYGAADSVIALATARLADLIDACRE
jgi:beta-1,4-mannooligosaccharide/beta-1,4-mannosyl-N-acetylglucosamine phosphorylase